MEDALYRDVLEVLVELKETLTTCDSGNGDADMDSSTSSPTLTGVGAVCRELSPAFLGNINALAGTLDAMLGARPVAADGGGMVVAAAASPPTTALALRTLVTRKLGDVMESARHVRHLTFQSCSGGGSSRSASHVSLTSGGVADPRSSEAVKARQVFRAASQNLEDAQRLLRIAYPRSPSLSTTAASSPDNSLADTSVAASDGQPTTKRQLQQQQQQRQRQRAGSSPDDKVRYSLGSTTTGSASPDRLGTSFILDVSPGKEGRGPYENGEDGDGDGDARTPRVSSGTAPYSGRSRSRDPTNTGGGGLTSNAPSVHRAGRGTTADSQQQQQQQPSSQWWFDGGIVSPGSTIDSAGSEQRQRRQHKEEGEQQQQQHRGSKGSSSSSSSSSSVASDGTAEPLRLDATQTGGGAAPLDADEGSEAHTPPSRLATLRPVPRGRSGSSASADSNDNDVSSRAGADSHLSLGLTGNGTGTDLSIDLAYFQSLSPTAAASAAKKNQANKMDSVPRAGSIGGSDTAANCNTNSDTKKATTTPPTIRPPVAMGLPPKSPRRGNNAISNSSSSSAGNSPTSARSGGAGSQFLLGSPPPPQGGGASRPVVHADGTHTTRHTQRLPGSHWREILATDGDMLHNAFLLDVMDLFNYGEETPQLYEEDMSDLAFRFIEGFLYVSAALRHRPGLTPADIDLRLGLFGFPEMTALYEDHHMFITRQQHRGNSDHTTVAGVREADERAVDGNGNGSGGGGKVSHHHHHPDGGGPHDPSPELQSQSLSRGSMAAALDNYAWPVSTAASDGATIPSVSLHSTGRNVDNSAATGDVADSRMDSHSSDSNCNRNHDNSNRRDGTLGRGDSSSSDRTLSMIPETSPTDALSPSSAVALKQFRQQQPAQPQQRRSFTNANSNTGSSNKDVITGAHHTATVPGPHWEAVVRHLSERVCRMLVVDEIASALELPSTAVENVALSYGSLVIGFDLYARPEARGLIPPPGLVDSLMRHCTFPVMMRVYCGTCNTLKLNPEDGMAAADDAAAYNDETERQRSSGGSHPPRTPHHGSGNVVQFFLPDMEALDVDSDEESMHRARAVHGAATAAATASKSKSDNKQKKANLPEPSKSVPVSSPPHTAASTGSSSSTRQPRGARPPGAQFRVVSASPEARPRTSAPPRPFGRRPSLSNSNSNARFGNDGEDEGPVSLLDLSLMHDVPVSKLREWNPHLANFDEEDAIPDDVQVTVPRAYGLEEDLYEEPDDLLMYTATEDDDEGTLESSVPRGGSVNGAGGGRTSTASQHLSVLRSQRLRSSSHASTVTTPASTPTVSGGGVPGGRCASGSRPRDNVRFVDPRLSQSPRNSTGGGGHPRAPGNNSSTMPPRTAEAAERDGDDADSTGSSPMPAQREWRPMPAPLLLPATIAAGAVATSNSRETSEEGPKATAPPVVVATVVAPAPSVQLRVASRRPEAAGEKSASPERKAEVEAVKPQRKQPPRRGEVRERKVPPPAPAVAATTTKATTTNAALATIPPGLAPPPPTEPRPTSATRVVTAKGPAATPPTAVAAQPPPPSSSSSSSSAHKAPPSVSQVPHLQHHLHHHQLQQLQHPPQSPESPPPSAHRQRMARAQPPPLCALVEERRRSAAAVTTAALLLRRRASDARATSLASSSSTATTTHPTAATATATATAHTTHVAATTARLPPGFGELPVEERVGRRTGLVVDPETLAVVRARGPAAAAGFRRGDVLRTVDGKAVRSLEEFGQYIASGAAAARGAVFITVQQAGGVGTVTTRRVVFDLATAMAADDDGGHSEAAASARQPRPAAANSNVINSGGSAGLVPLARSEPRAAPVASTGGDLPAPPPQLHQHQQRQRSGRAASADVSSRGLHTAAAGSGDGLPPPAGSSSSTDAYSTSVAQLTLQRRPAGLSPPPLHPQQQQQQSSRGLAGEHDRDVGNNNITNGGMDRIRIRSRSTHQPSAVRVPRRPSGH